MSREIPITQGQSKNLIFGIFTIALLVWFYDVFPAILRNMVGSSNYYVVQDLVGFVFAGIIIIIGINTFFDLNLIKFKKDEAFEFTDAEIKKIKLKLEM